MSSYRDPAYCLRVLTLIRREDQCNRESLSLVRYISATTVIVVGREHSEKYETFLKVYTVLWL